MSEPLRIAIVGVGAQLPGAASIDAFWTNVLAGRDCSRDVPAGRWPIDPTSVLQSGGPSPDTVYSLRGYFLDHIPNDADVDPQLDPLFHLSVAICRSAWTDAVTDSIDRRRVGVVLGSIALPTERISTLSRELLGSIIIISGEPCEMQMADPRHLDVVGRPASLVAEVLGLGGLRLTLDAACASSLYALKIACDELTAGRADAMLAGGLNRSDSLYTQMGFAQLRALSPSGRCSPFDARADGLLVGEGGAAFLLKRLNDAERAGDRIYGVITGIGLSNDVGGSLLAPSSEGQLRAMRAAYQHAGWSASDIQYVECHATGTPVGDAVELASLRELGLERCALGAVKSTVGHLLTGAGAVSLLKVVLALQHETIPPTANFSQPAPDSPLSSGRFEVLRGPKEWLIASGSPRRAAINAFGFGGVNAHVLIEEYAVTSRAASRATATPSVPIAIVGIGAHFGPWTNRESLAGRLIGDDPRPGDHSRIDAVTIPVDRVRVPPSELQACLLQQLLILRTAAEAIDDADGLRDPQSTGAFIGIALDPNTTNFDFRWAQQPSDRDSAGPPLTADRVMGHLGSVAASRVARAFDLGGPSFTVSAGRDSGLVALRLAVEALRRNELRQALVGAVDLPSDVRTQQNRPSNFCDGAAVMVLKRLDDAHRAGRAIYAVIDGADGSSLAVDAIDDIGDAGAAASMASLVKACLVTDKERCATVVRGDRESARLIPSDSAGRKKKASQADGRSLVIEKQLLAIPARGHTANASVPLPDSGRRVMAAIGAMAEAHETFLRLTTATQRSMEETLRVQTTILEQLVQASDGATAFARQPSERKAREPSKRQEIFLDRPQCLEFAVGQIGPVLGPQWAAIDAFPTRVRLPDEPLMLADRIVSIEGEPLSLTHGRIVTEHDCHSERWYLDNGVAPPSIAIESGQADLFLAAWLGVDFHTQGRAFYRLLDAAVTFYRELPRLGETVRYDIRIKEFFRQGQTLLFRFEFDGTIAGQPLLSMRNGCAGFFTPGELAAGQGVVRTELQRRPQAGKSPPSWEAPCPVQDIERYSSEQLNALRRGDLATAFRVDSLPDASFTLPKQNRLHLIDRVTHFDPKGGRFGLGLIRGEADIHADDWFLTCHFIDDQVMPGTLMYECCLHTLRIALLRMGYVGNADATWQPVLGVTSRLKCRGQVTAATKTVAYEIAIKEIGDGPEPFAIADALMYADGKAIVDVQDMTLRLNGIVSPSVERERDRRAPASLPLDRRRNTNLFDREQIIEFATGLPSRAFGERYTPFDRDRFIARLPAPPYSFLDRIVSATVEPWQMTAGGSATAEYDVPADAWYFAAVRQPIMPYAVLLEIALQACGWVSAYVGSALHSTVDLHYRNLGGRGTVRQTVGPNSGMLRTTVKLTKVSKSGGMIIQHFDFAVRDSAGRDVYVGDTYFGFFTAEALGQQVGLRDAQLFESAESVAAFAFPRTAPFPDSMLRMVDRIDSWLPDGGPHGQGFIRGSKAIDPKEWFFQAHFYGDPVWPGSLGIEAFLQLLQVAAVKHWGETTAWQSPALGIPHEWSYRGQVTPADRLVTVQAEVTTIDEEAHTLMADGWLLVDGRAIYQMKDFALRHTM